MVRCEFCVSFSSHVCSWNHVVTKNFNRRPGGYMIHFYKMKGAKFFKTPKRKPVWKPKRRPATYSIPDDVLVAAHNETNPDSMIKLEVSSRDLEIHKYKRPQLPPKGRMFSNEQVSATRVLYEQKPIKKRWERAYTEQIKDVNKRVW